MFKIYNPGIGEELGGGGRYDRLFDRFGMDVPAVGCGFNLARLAEAASRNGYAEAAHVIIDPGKPTEALKEIVKRRNMGEGVVLREEE
jgi:ATP phosphoribosyltransferase regulatory subunit